MVTTRPPKTIVKPTALGPVANTDTKLLIYGLFRKGRVLAQDGVLRFYYLEAARVFCPHGQSLVPRSYSSVSPRVSGELQQSLFDDRL